MLKYCLTKNSISGTGTFVNKLLRPDNLVPMALRFVPFSVRCVRAGLVRDKAVRGISMLRPAWTVTTMKPVPACWKELGQSKAKEFCKKVDRTVDVLERFVKVWGFKHRLPSSRKQREVRRVFETCRLTEPWSVVDSEVQRGGLLAILRLARAEEVLRNNANKLVFMFHVKKMLKLMRERIDERAKQSRLPSYTARLTCGEAEFHSLVRDMLEAHKRERADLTALITWIREMKIARANYLEQVKVWTELTMKRKAGRTSNRWAVLEEE
jgi:hypothetical protein